MHTKTDETSGCNGRQIDDARRDPRGQNGNAELSVTETVQRTCNLGLTDAQMHVMTGTVNDEALN